MKARAADQSGYVERDGVRIYYEASGSGPAVILVLPTWSVLDASHGRFQVADLSRRYRVVTFDPRGNGRSDRPQGRAAYAGAEFVQDAVAVLDATGTEAAVVVACSVAANWLLALAAFRTWRSSDELHFVDFMVLNDLVADEPVDLVIADGAWGIDHHLHENPEMKQFAFAWLTDFVGWIPEPDADDRRRCLMADANRDDRTGRALPANPRCRVPGGRRGRSAGRPLRARAPVDSGMGARSVRVHRPTTE